MRTTWRMALGLVLVGAASLANCDSADGTEMVLSRATGGTGGAAAGGTGSAVPTVCTLGDQRDCVGPGDCAGYQNCAVHEQGWDACLCHPTTGGSSGLQCVTNLDCLVAGRYCDTSRLVCVECLAPSHCVGGADCVANTCVEVAGCAGPEDCPTDELCNVETGVCGECLDVTHCGSGQHCTAGMCQDDVCAPGSTACVGNSVATCNSSGDGYETPDDCGLLTCAAIGDGAACEDSGTGGGGGAGGAAGDGPWAPTEGCLALVDRYLQIMSVDEKVGQTTMAIGGGTFDTDDVRSYLLGSVAAGGSDVPLGGPPAANWASYADTLQSIALSTRLGIPLLFAVDAVHGMSKATDAVIFPHGIGLGASGDAALVEQVGRTTALEMAGSGVNWTFAPTVAAVRDERWGRTYEAFGETPEVTGAMGLAAVLGLQDTRLGNSTASVVACAKHFAGDGATTYGTSNLPGAYLDRGDVELDEATFRQLALDQYRPVVEAGVGTIMVSFSSWNGDLMHGHEYLLTEVLKTELGFQGFLVSDWAAINDLTGEFTEDVSTAIGAGLDMIMVPPSDSWAAYTNTLRSLVNDGGVSEARLDDAVRRILTIKCEAGLFAPGYSGRTDPSLTGQVGSSEHRAVGRDAVRKSLVLLQNDNDVLPLSSTSRIHVTGPNADSLENQCGGWTINWQGDGDRAAGTTIRSGIERVVGAANLVADAGSADVVVVVVGETPYAEWYGDAADLTLSSSDQSLIASAAGSGKPVVVILVSGRPMIVTGLLSQADAWLAAWLPGTEGDGVADVLFGDYAPTGKLTHSWPRDMEQIPINQGDAPYDPLFPYGHGLTY